MVASAQREATVHAATTAKAIQAAIVARLAEDVARVWPALDPKRVDATWPRWLELMTALIARYRSLSSMGSSIFYQDLRATLVGEPLPDALVRIAGDVDPQQLDRALGYAGPGQGSLSIVQGTSARLVVDAGRTTTLDTAKADRKALGWYRQTDARPCAFCALLASRVVAFRNKPGGSLLYKEHSFEASNARFTGEGTIKVHNDCACIPAPLFAVGQSLPEMSARAHSVYDDIAHLPNAQRLGAFRKAWNAHLAATAEPAA